MNRFLLAGGLLVCPVSVVFAASCESISSVATVNPGTITLQRDVTVGQPISEWFESPIVEYRNCEFDSEAPGYRVLGINTVNSASSGLNYENYRIFDTNLPGVGMIIGLYSSAKTANDPFLYGYIRPGMTSAEVWNQLIAPNFKHQVVAKAHIRLIKTGAITGGALTGNIGNIYHKLKTPLPTIPVTFSGGTINVVSCSVTTPNINVPLGKQAKSSFKGVGSGTEWQSFDIQLNCIKGARINVRLDATAAPATTRKDIMRLDPESGDIAAKGVGIQIGYRMGYELELGKTLLYETSKFDTEFILLRARYYQTEENVIAGKANGTATFTLTYK